MSGIPYRGSRPDVGGWGGPPDRGYPDRAGFDRGGNRWDSDRFATERTGRRFDSPPEREFFEERDSRTVTRGGGFGRPRERSVDEIYERRGPGFGDDRYERRHYHDDDVPGPRYERERAPPNPFDPWERRTSTQVLERDREFEAPPRRGSNRPAFLRRQSSLDTFDRKPLTRFVEREQYGPPARYREDVRPPINAPIPLPVTRQLGPPRGYQDRSFEEIRVSEPDYYGDDDYRPYPERVREREVIRRRRRSRSRDSIRSRRSHRDQSVRSSSVSSSSSSDRGTVRSEFPKRGKTRMPARLVSKKAIIDLGYPFIEEGDTIIIQRALGRENIDEVIKLSEDYKESERVVETEQTTYVVGSGGAVPAGGNTTVIEEHKTQEIFTVPPPPAPLPPYVPPPPPPPPVQEVVTDTKIVEHHHGGGGPVIVNAHPHHHHHHDHVTEIQTVERVPEPIILEPLAVAAPISSRARDEAAIRAEIRALELEKEALRRRRRGKSVGATDLVVYDKEHFHTADEEVTVVRKEKIIEPDGGVRIEKDRKGRMAISVPKYYR